MLTARSSGNLLADRRFALAADLVAEGDPAGGADLLRQVLELVPDWAPAWLALGQALERCGKIAEAASALHRAVELDDMGELGAALHLARVDGSTPAAMSPHFVASLFDQYADRFETHLVGTLGYRGPALIAEMLRALRDGHFTSVLDLGCGTGLMARALTDQADAIDGVDLSPRMIDLARQTGLYRHLFTGEIVTHLGTLPIASYDLLVAADVFVYLGDLAAAIAQSARVLVAGGTLAFSVQLRPEGSFALGTDMRFSHSRDYLAQILADAGFGPTAMQDGSTRNDGGTAVPGLLVASRRP